MTMNFLLSLLPVSFIQIVLILILILILNSPASSASPIQLFRRNSSQNTHWYPEPNQVPDISHTPQSWSAALIAAQSKIPDLPLSSIDSNGDIHYPSGFGSHHDLCSWRVTKCLGENDIFTAPTNMIGLNFDDGPSPASFDLYRFLASNNQSSTHFLIGSNVLAYPEAIKLANEEGNQQFAVHTWSHTIQTTLTNEEVVAELGWTMQIIYDLTGKIPSLWRPPQGDVDNRVRSIAENVFGLTTTLWNYDSNDWCIGQDGRSVCPNENPGSSDQSVTDAIQSFITENVNKSEGIILLEHELTSYSVNHLKAYYPELSRLGWSAKSIAELDGRHWYSNAVDGISKTTDQKEMAVNYASEPEVSTSFESQGDSPDFITATSTTANASVSSDLPSTASKVEKNQDNGVSFLKVPPLTLLGSFICLIFSNIV